MASRPSSFAGSGGGASSSSHARTASASTSSSSSNSNNNNRARQYAHLHAALAQLNAHLADTDNLLRMTAVQAEYVRGLGGWSGGLFMAAAKVLGEEGGNIAAGGGSAGAGRGTAAAAAAATAGPKDGAVESSVFDQSVGEAS